MFRGRAGVNEIIRPSEKLPDLSEKGKTFRLRVGENLVRKKHLLEGPLQDKRWRAGLGVSCLGEPGFQSF